MRSDTRVLGNRLTELRELLMALAEAKNEGARQQLLLELTQFLQAMGISSKGTAMASNVLFDQHIVRTLTREMNFAEELQAGSSPIEARGWGWWAIWVFAPAPPKNTPTSIRLDGQRNQSKSISSELEA